MPPSTSGEARAYPRPLPNPVWLGKLSEEILEPDLPIVDPHHHIWDHPGSRYLLDELLADVGSGHNIVATVFIQCGSGYRTSGPEEMRPIGESEFVRGIAEEGDRRGGKTKICAGIISWLSTSTMRPASGATWLGRVAEFIPHTTACGGFLLYAETEHVARACRLRRAGLAYLRQVRPQPKG